MFLIRSISETFYNDNIRKRPDPKYPESAFVIPKRLGRLKVLVITSSLSLIVIVIAHIQEQVCLTLAIKMSGNR